MVLSQLEDEPVLMQLVFLNDLPTINKIITEANCDVNEPDSCGRTALHAAAFCGFDEIVDKLLLSGARVNKKDETGLTALHRACIQRHDNVVEKLLCHQADITCRDRNFLTPLHYCAMHNAFDCVKYILPILKAEWINVGDHFGRPALHYASYLGHFEIVDYLLENGAIAFTQDKLGRQATHWACGAGHWDIARLLFQAGAEISARDRELLTPLHCASCMGHYNVVSYLLSPEANAQINAVSIYGHCALHLAVNNGHLIVVQRLTEHKDIDINMKDLKGLTPLHYACASSDGYQCMLHLIQKGADVTVTSNTGKTLLHLTSICGRFSRVDALLNSGVDLHAVDENGEQAIMIACRYGHELLVKKLLSAGAEPNCIGRYKRSPLHVCCLYGFAECARSLVVEAKAEIELKDEHKRTPLHLAASSLNSSSQCVSFLLNKGAKYDVLDCYKRSPLHYACMNGNGHSVEILMEAGSDPTGVDVFGRGPIHYAAISDKDGSCLSVLKIGGADETKRDEQGLMPIHYAANYNNALACKMLIEMAQDCGALLALTPKTKTSALHLACKREESFETVNAIFTACSSKNLRQELDYAEIIGVHDCCHMTPLMWACTTQHATNVAQLLYRVERDQRLHILRLKTAEKGWNCLHFAALNRVNHLKGALSTVEFASKEDLKGLIDCRDSIGRTPLMLAINCANSCQESVPFLLEMGADPALRDNFGRNTLHRAAVWSSVDIIETLLSHDSLKSDPLRPDKQGVTPLHLAIMKKRNDVLQAMIKVPGIMISFGAFTVALGPTVPHMRSVSMQTERKESVTRYISAGGDRASRASLASVGSGFSDKHGFTPLHWAAYNGDATCMESLLEIGALRCFGFSKITPVHCAAWQGHDICIDLLVKACGREVVLGTDGNYRTPMHYAALRGKRECVECLYENGANLDPQDELGRTPLILAVQNGHTLVFDFLMAKGASFKIVDGEKNSTLHIACINGQETIACSLVENSQSTAQFVDAKNNKGQTALHIASMKGMYNVVEKLILKGASAWIRDDNDRIAVVGCAPTDDVADCMELLISIMLPEPNHNDTITNRMSLQDVMKSRRSRLSSINDLSKEASNTTLSSDSEFY